MYSKVFSACNANPIVSNEKASRPTSVCMCVRERDEEKTNTHTHKRARAAFTRNTLMQMHIAVCDTDAIFDNQNAFHQNALMVISRRATSTHANNLTMMMHICGAVTCISSGTPLMPNHIIQPTHHTTNGCMLNSSGFSRSQPHIV